jgi:hypothetical protein
VLRTFATILPAPGAAWKVTVRYLRTLTLRAAAPETESTADAGLGPPTRRSFSLTVARGAGALRTRVTDLPARTVSGTSDLAAASATGMSANAHTIPATAPRESA